MKDYSPLAGLPLKHLECYVRSRREAGDVRRGEVLVTRAAGPDWTPLRRLGVLGR